MYLFLIKYFVITAFSLKKTQEFTLKGARGGRKVGEGADGPFHD